MNWKNTLLILLEDTPSKTEIKVKKALGLGIRPEDEPGLDPGARRQRIRTRKGQHSTRPLSGGRTRKLKRKLKSKVYTPSERSFIQSKLARLEKRGKAKSLEEIAARIKQHKADIYAAGAKAKQVTDDDDEKVKREKRV